MSKLFDILTLNVDLGELEEDFRARYFKFDIEQTRLAIIVTNIAVISLATIDFLLLDFSTKFFIHLMVRGLFVLLSLATYFLLQRETCVERFETTTMIWGLTLVAAVLFVDYSRPRDFTQNIPLNIILAFSMYIMLPTRPRNRIIIPLLMTLGNLWIIFAIKDVPNPTWLGVVASSYLILHLAGILTTLRTYNARKIQFRSEYEQRRANQKLRQLAITDDLTDTYNRRYFLERAKEEFERYLRYRHPLSLMIADLDLLKKINDTYGHQAGDIAIRQFSNLITREKRSIDILGRLGGEEFGLLMPDTNLEEAMVVIKRIYEQRNILTVRTAESDIRFSFSAGATECISDYKTLDDLFRAADQALYRAKDNGRDRVEVG